MKNDRCIFIADFPVVIIIYIFWRGVTDLNS